MEETIRLEDVQTNSMYGDAQSLQYKFDVDTEIHVIHYNEPGNLIDIPEDKRHRRIIKSLMLGILQVSNAFVEEFKRLRRNPATPFEEYEKLIGTIAQKKDIYKRPLNEVLFNIKNDNGVVTASIRIETDKLDIFFDRDRVDALEFLSRFRPRQEEQGNNLLPKGTNNLSGGRRRKTSKRRAKKKGTRRH